jgi:hypothetical protein
LRTATIRFYNEKRDCQLSEVVGGNNMNIGLLIGFGILSACAFMAWAVLRRPLRQIVEDVHVDHARALFHQQREWLEARFVSAIGNVDQVDGQRWETAQWHDEVLWARDRQTRHLLALVCVHFDPGPFEEVLGRRHATALFEFRKGHWCVDGKNLDEMRPDEAVGRNQRFEEVVVSQPHPRRVG